MHANVEDPELNTYLGAADLKAGDEVSFESKTGRRGAFAVQVRVLDSQRPIVTQGIRGEVTHDYDLHRHTPGTIETSDTAVSSDMGTIFPFRLMSESNVRRPLKVSKGDEVKFDVHYISGSSYATATNLTLMLSKRAKKRQQLIDEMIAAGATLERGIVDNVITDYGFISPENRPDEVYFRNEDVSSEDGAALEISKVEYLLQLLFM